ncbi:hypothetical protein PRZ48_015231 [Zasmidium cellare]|uniref:F-box domain-containing protein n=1 Tax=Zasmidium cellare TaxID=395010 RepID=A0ABR0DY09_ZASCE|nr:hypothetical protein PRZ48_015231 [Zasmidium cellare]
MADDSEETPPSTAAQRVLNLPELLESVIMSLPIEDMFAFQRINSTFRDTIKDCKAIRQAMHLELPEGDDAPETITDLFSKARHDDHTFASRALELAIEPLQLGYRGTEEGFIRINCDTTYDWYHAIQAKRLRQWHSRLDPIVKSSGSWRRIRIGWKDLPISVTSRYRPFVEVKMGSPTTLGGLVDAFSKGWTLARRQAEARRTWRL